MQVLEWFQPAPKLVLEWFGPSGRTLVAAGLNQIAAIAVVIGPRGPRGLPGNKGDTGAGVDDDPGDLVAFFQSA